jgi:SAM-dependent methyltransferase
MFDSYGEIFEVRAGSYQAAMEHLPAARDAEFAAMLAPLALRAGLRLYDMPSGGGYLHRHLPAGLDYTAIEPSAVFAEACPAGPACHVVAAPIEAVPLPPARADAIVSLAGLHHCPDASAVFREMRRLLRPGGTAVIADVADGTAPARFLDGFVDAHNPIGHRGAYLDDRTAGLLSGAGLVPIEDRMVDVPWRFADRLEAGAYCAALFGLAGVMPRAVADAIEAVVGGDAGPGGYAMRWSLRRIVCRAF